MALRESFQGPESTPSKSKDVEPWLERLVGNELIASTGDGFETIPTMTCRGKHILLYVSAQWCGPCRKFTPLLQEFYSEAKKRTDINLEIVFVSLDKDASSHNCLLYTSPSPRDRQKSRMPSSA